MLRQSEKLPKLAGHVIVKHMITIRQEPKCPSIGVYMETSHSHQEEQRPRIYSETEKFHNISSKLINMVEQNQNFTL